ncbi:c-type cytochrome [Methylocystis bryophila]|uniref:c-type cytochrome n=1 Tax=Methylocystis bryophila TaxID=655015 RepID=UPI001FDA9AC2|nr:c-type cytochrome [Methylocystis bryophila]
MTRTRSFCSSAGQAAAIAFACWSSSPGTQAQEALPTRNCTWCHGSSAQGFSTAPRIAGQKPHYIVRELLAFKDHSRDNPTSAQYMWGATARVSPELASEFAAYFAALPAEPANDGNSALVEAGKALYVQGAAEANVVSCVVCHGPNGEGFEAIPRLGGLSYGYLKSRLEQWSQGFHASAYPMPRVATSLSPEEIDALASYLSFLK